MKREMKKKITAFVLAFAMIVTLLPNNLGKIIARAEETSQARFSVEMVEKNQRDETKLYEISGGYYLTTDAGYTEITGGYYKLTDYSENSMYKKTEEDSYRVVTSEDLLTIYERTVEEVLVAQEIDNSEPTDNTDEESSESTDDTEEENKQETQEIVTYSRVDGVYAVKFAAVYSDVSTLYSPVFKVDDVVVDDAIVEKKVEGDSATCTINYDGLTFSGVTVSSGASVEVKPELNFANNSTADVYSNGTDSFILDAQSPNGGIIEYEIVNQSSPNLNANITNDTLTASGKREAKATVQAKLVGKSGTVYATAEAVFQFKKPSLGGIEVVSIDGKTLDELYHKEDDENNAPWINNPNPVVVLSLTDATGITEDMISVNGATKKYDSSSSELTLEFNDLKDGLITKTVKYSKDIQLELKFNVDTVAPTADNRILQTRREIQSNNPRSQTSVTYNIGELTNVKDNGGSGIKSVQAALVSDEQYNKLKNGNGWEDIQTVTPEEEDSEQKKHSDRLNKTDYYSVKRLKGAYYTAEQSADKSNLVFLIEDNVGNKYLLPNENSGDAQTGTAVTFEIEYDDNTTVTDVDSTRYFKGPVQIKISTKTTIRQGTDVKIILVDGEGNEKRLDKEANALKQGTAMITLSDVDENSIATMKSLSVKIGNNTDYYWFENSIEKWVVDTKAPEVNVFVENAEWTIVTNNDTDKVYIKKIVTAENNGNDTFVDGETVKITVRATDDSWDDNHEVSKEYGDINPGEVREIELPMLENIVDPAGNVATVESVQITANGYTASLNNTCTEKVTETNEDGTPVVDEEGNSVTTTKVQAGKFSGKVYLDTKSPVYISGNDKILLCDVDGNEKGEDHIFNNTIQAKLYITDGDVQDGYNSGIQSINYGLYLADSPKNENGEYPKCEDMTVKCTDYDGNPYSLSITPGTDENGNVKQIENDQIVFWFRVTDKAGNTRTLTRQFKYDNIAPQVDVVLKTEAEKAFYYDIDGDGEVDNVPYVNKDCSLSVTVSDHNAVTTNYTDTDGSETITGEGLVKEIKSDGQYSMGSFESTDAAGNPAEVSYYFLTYGQEQSEDTKADSLPVSIIVDKTAPVLDITVKSNDEEPNTVESVDYYDQDVTVTAILTEANIDDDQTEVSFDAEFYVTDITEQSPTWKLTLTDGDNSSTQGGTLSGITASITDRAGNPATYNFNGNSVNVEGNTYQYTGNTIVVDKYAPEITIDTPDTSTDLVNSNGTEFYYRNKQSITVTVVDVNLDTREGYSYITYKVDGQDRGQLLNNPMAGGKSENKIWVEEGHMVSDIEVYAVDNATKSTTKSVQNKYIVDTTAPSVALSIKDNMNQIESYSYDLLAGKIYIQFRDPAIGQSGEWATSGSSHDITLTVNVTDANITTDASGYDEKGFQLTSRPKSFELEDKSLNTERTATYTQMITVKPDGTGVISFKLHVQDLAGNVPSLVTVGDDVQTKETLEGAIEKRIVVQQDGTISGTFVADQNRTSSNDDTKAPVIVMNPTATKVNTVTNKDGESVDLYANSMSYSMTVTDPAVQYDDYTTDAISSEIVYSGLKSVTWKVTDSAGLNISGGDNSLNAAHAKVFDVGVGVGANYENNDIKIEVTAIDQMGNTTTYIQKLAIDNYAPRVTASYSNNSVQNEKYYKADRVLNVTIEDLNFEPARTTLTSEIGASGWSSLGGNKYQATINYNHDGDYTFKMETADKAGNAATINDSIFASGITAPWAFTVDKTAPVITISFDNNSYQNGKYFKDSRIATINIAEHNFRASDVTIVTTPAVNGWGGSGDNHVATANYTIDGIYTLQADYTDLAGNPAETQKVDEFVIDLIDPVIEILSPENQHAYTGTVTPTIKLTDTNFDINGYTVSWTITKLTSNGPVEAEYGMETITDGIQLNFQDVAATEDNDGIYQLTLTLTDLAGRTAETQSIVYSVNRTGTVFVVEDNATKNLIGGYSTKENVPNVVIRAYNANAIKSVSVKVNNKELSTSDYTVKQVSASGWYCYEYSIKPSVFEEDGNYDVTITTVDEAGNTTQNKNTIHSDEKQVTVTFTVDNELPSGVAQIDGLDKNTVKAEEATITVTWEDGYTVAKVIIYVDGEPMFVLEGEELKNLNGSYTFTLPQRAEDYVISAEIYDAAGNVYNVPEQKVLINTSGLRLFMHNTTLFYGSIAGIAILLLLILLLLLKRRKDEEEKRAA